MTNPQLSHWSIDFVKQGGLSQPCDAIFLALALG